MSVYLLTDMTREIAGLRARRQDVQIQAGSLDALSSAISRIANLKAEDAKGTAALTFAGIKVIERDILPPNTAVIVSDGEIITIIKFDNEQAEANA
jgi:hypothetical protein